MGISEVLALVALIILLLVEVIGKVKLSRVNRHTYAVCYQTFQLLKRDYFEARRVLRLLAAFENPRLYESLKRQFDEINIMLLETDYVKIAELYNTEQNPKKLKDKLSEFEAKVVLMYKVYGTLARAATDHELDRKLPSPNKAQNSSAVA